MRVGGAGRYTRSFCKDGRHSGHKNVAVIEGWPPNRGFLCTILNGDAVGTKTSGRYREGGRLSGVAVKRGSTVARLLSKCTVMESLYPHVYMWLWTHLISLGAYTQTIEEKVPCFNGYSYVVFVV